MPEEFFNSLSIHEAREELTAFWTRMAETAYILYLMGISCQSLWSYGVSSETGLADQSPLNILHETENT